MRGSTILAVVLIVIGVIALAYQGITYSTRKKIIDIGSLQATTEEHHTFPLPPIVGIVALAGGVAVLALAKRGT
ncbi:MAG: DUF3185 domain-containing protein [Candidatus Acidiferrales bacterium]|jgi:uncharacterized membrane protein YidH (DUF202 family)